jgi:hypothetical protein
VRWLLCEMVLDCVKWCWTVWNGAGLCEMVL